MTAPLLKWIAVSAAVIVALLCAAVFDAASVSQASLDLGQVSQSLPKGRTRAQVLSRASVAVEGSWSQATRWHAGALEALSWVKALEAENAPGDGSALRESRLAAEKSVAIAPIQPVAWMRLAALSLHGQPTGLCNPSRCVALSFAAAPILEPALACERLQIAAATGTEISPAIVAGYVASRPQPADATRCLSMLSPHLRFEALMALQIQSSADRRVRHRFNDMN